MHVMELILPTKTPIAVADSFDRISRSRRGKRHKQAYSVGSLLQAIGSEQSRPARTASAVQAALR